jgi:hypothetical protein
VKLRRQMIPCRDGTDLDYHHSRQIEFVSKYDARYKFCGALQCFSAHYDSDTGAIQPYIVYCVVRLRPLRTGIRRQGLAKSEGCHWRQGFAAEKFKTLYKLFYLLSIF